MSSQHAIAIREGSALLPSAERLQTMLTVSENLHKSGLLPQHIKTPQAAFAIIQKGLELGIPPMHALSNIVCIQGKPTCNSELMLALIYRDHGDGAIQFRETSATRCTIQYLRRNWTTALFYDFTIEDAKRAGLGGQQWQRYPAAMLRARCISAVARLAFPDSIGGMYTPEELGAAVTVQDDGEIVIDPPPVTQLRPVEPLTVVYAEPVAERADECEATANGWSEDNWCAGEAARKNIVDREVAASERTGQSIGALRLSLLNGAAPWTLDTEEAWAYAAALRKQ